MTGRRNEDEIIEKVRNSFWTRVDRNGPAPTEGTLAFGKGVCWLWRGGVTDKGYGSVQIRSTTRPCGRLSMSAHRVAYELTYGAIPNRLPLDHLCRVRRCVNPDHLEPVTNQENILRSPLVSRTSGQHQRQKTHCPRGHAYDAQNTILDHRGHRKCLSCKRLHAAKHRAKKKALR